VDLFSEISRSSRTGIDIESNKGESALVSTAMVIDEFARAESHVCLERHGRTDARGRVRPDAGSANVRKTNEPFEVCYLAGVVDVRNRDGGIQRKVVDHDRERFERSHAPRNRIGTRFLRISAAMFVEGMRGLWQ